MEILRAKQLYVHKKGKDHPSHIHGKTGTKVYNAWLSMKKRLKVSPFYKDIIICKEWESFINFYNDMGDPPPETSLDRIDNAGNYEKSNCRWASNSVSSFNKRYTKKNPLPRGVFQRGKKFQATIRINGKEYYLGMFTTSEKAHLEYKKMCIEWYGTYKDY